jgi:hypothetical protein
MTAPLRTVDIPAAEARTTLRAAPPLEPPYEDETPAPARVSAPELRIVPTPGWAAQLPFDQHRRALRRAGQRGGDEAPPAARAELADPRLHASRLLRAILEVLGRQRPLPQLLPWTSDAVYEELTAWLYRTASRRTPLAALRSVRVSEPGDGVAEVTAVIVQAERARAVALRLEGIDGRWCCTLFRML